MRIGLILSIACLVVLDACTPAREHGQDHPGYVVPVERAVDSLVTIGQMSRGKAVLDSVYRALENPGTGDRYELLARLNYIYGAILHDNTMASLYADSMMLVIKEDVDAYPEQWAHSLFSKGDALLGLKNYGEAFEFYYQGRRFVQQRADSCGMSQFTNRLAGLRYKQGRYRDAVGYYKEAVLEHGYCTDRTDFYKYFAEGQGQVNSVGICYERMNVMDTALYYYNLALNFIKEREPFFTDPRHRDFIEQAKGVIYGNLGGVYLHLKDYGNAESYLKEGIRLNDRPDHPIRDAQLTKEKLASLFIETERYREADELLRDLRRSLDTIPNREAELRWRKRRWIYYDRTAPNGPLAYAALLNYLQLKDSVDAAQRELFRVDFVPEFRLLDQEYQVALLSKEDEQKTMFLWVAIVILSMSIVIGLLVWYDLRRSRKHVAKLTRLNRTIREQNIQLHRTLEALEQSQEDNTRMMKIVAHDLRSPVGGIDMIAATLLHEGGHTDDHRGMLQLIRTTSTATLELIGQLLHVHGKKENLKLDPVNLHMLLQYCVDVARFRANDKGQQLILETVPVVMMLDRERIWRVLSNLIGNAIKFSPDGSAITIRMMSESGAALIEVEDNGIGIPDSIKDRIFDMFTDAKRPGTSGEESFGLGLAISKQIVEAHGGRLWFESSVDRGTVFRVQLPGPIMEISSTAEHDA
ncbi:MAG: hypothetical protein BGO89_05495 [Candidatus Kapaibacterium thiocyanatum]|uniref:histidine kinase n=1 Tax=Candidatus Kapaibacterium thiocyanatum TaxID=1895771 RepID=A0A1M3L1G1_9BACT|nr:MAG: hypothetical protein BGO89_05495 ['Candidatus Kapabacteria' thiocyanatum]